MRQIDHFIVGDTPPATRKHAIWNPSTGEVQAEVALGDAALLARAVETAKRVQPAWAATNPQRRARVMMEVVRLLNRTYTKAVVAAQTMPAMIDIVTGVGFFAVLMLGGREVASGDRTVPADCSRRVQRIVTGARPGRASTVSSTGPGCPPQMSSIRRVMYSMWSTVVAKSTPRSKRCAASVEKL